MVEDGASISILHSRYIYGHAPANSYEQFSLSSLINYKVFARSGVNAYIS